MTTLGRYIPINGWVHRMDARVKLLATIALMVTLFLDYGSWAMTFTVLGLLFAFVIVLLLSCRIGLRTVFTSLRSLWFMFIFLFIIYIVVPTASPTLPVAWDLNGWVVYWDAFAQAGKIILRLTAMLLVTMVLTSSTKPLDLTYALEWYLTPLKLIKLPTAEIAMMVSIALRFIPTLLEDAQRVMKAQASRGVDFKKGHLWAKITGITSLIIPLFVSSFLRSEELANAMECRGYDPRLPRTRYRKLHFKWSDILFLLFILALLAGCIVMVALHFNVYALFGVTVL